MPPKRRSSVEDESVKRSKQDSEDPRPHSKQYTLASFWRTESSSTPSISLSASLPKSSSASTSGPNSPFSPPFLQPIFGRVFNKLVSDANPVATFKLRDLCSAISSRSTLQNAVICTPYLDADWLFPSVGETVDILLVTNKQSKQDKRKAADAKKKDGKICFHDLLGQEDDDGLCELEGRERVRVKLVADLKSEGSYGVFHPKLLLLRFDTHLRVVISTGNFTRRDWHINDNSVWVQDFPPLPSSSSATSEFGTELLRGVQIVVGEDSAVDFDWLARYDFSATEGKDGARLIWSLGQKYSAEKADVGTGLCYLPKALKSFGFAPCKAQGGKGYWEVEAQTSSLSAFHSNFLWHFLACASGVHPRTYLPNPPPKAKLLPSTVPLTALGTPTPPSGIKIGFPTQGEIEHAQRTRGNDNPGSCIWLSSTLDRNPDSLPDHVKHEQRNKRNGVISHSKTILALHKYEESTLEKDQVHEGWVYMGSHNFGHFAWGEIQQSGKLSVKNTELGVVFPIRASSAEELEKKVKALMPYKREMARYTANDRMFSKET